MNKQRLYYIDLLKVVGLFLVILAHVDAPNIIIQIRSFDVPLLVFISSYLASISYKENTTKLYLKKRFSRLVLPTWIFLVIFFCAQTIAYSVPRVIDIIKAFLLQRDACMVGMVWVIWVYLLNAFLVPIMAKIKFNRYSLVCFVVILVVYDLICWCTDLYNNRLLYCTFFTIIPYGFLTFLGFNYDQMKYKQKLLIACACITIFIITFFRLNYEGRVLLSDYKYPIRIFYLSYSIPIIFILFVFFKKMIKSPIPRILCFISKSSLWIYLWHILVLYIIKAMMPNDNFWLIQYILIIISSVLITWVQNKVVDRTLKNNSNHILKFFKG